MRVHFLQQQQQNKLRRPSSSWQKANANAGKVHICMCVRVALSLEERVNRFLVCFFFEIKFIFFKHFKIKDV